MRLGKIPGWLGLILVWAFITLIFMLMFVSPPQDSAGLLEPLLEALKNSLLFSLGYHFKNTNNGGRDNGGD